MNRLQQEMNRSLGNVAAGSRRTATYPALDIWQDADCLYVESELPGLELSDLEILVTGGDQLSIKGERQAPSSDGETWHRRERGYGKFSRLVTLAIEVDAERVEANLRNGVLTIKLPKREEAKPRKIEVMSG
jgi:HSP20 family protein